MLIPILIELLVIYLWWSSCDMDDIIDTIMELFFLLIWSSIGVIIGICMAGLIGLAIPANLQLHSSHNLASINIKDGVQGSFFLGSGYIESQPYYFYMEKIEDGFAPRKIQITDNIIIKESTAIHPKLDNYQPEFKHKFLNLFADPGFHASKHIFTIPTGSIKNNFTMQ